MAKLKTGDRIDCLIKLSNIVSPYKDYDEIRTFQIISVDSHGYYLYVPEYYGIKDTTRVDNSKCKILNIDLKFIGDEFTYIQENMVFRVHTVLDGLSCANCEEFFRMAEANQEDGTLICYSCRKNPYR